MTLQQLRYVVMVADTGTITEAANRLYISQPSLTNAIHELEKEMGINIFNRSNKGISPSIEGEVFLGYARQVLEQAKVLEDKYKGDDGGKKSFCVSTQHYSFAVNAFVDLIKRYGQDEYDFSIRETQTYEIIDDVARMRSEIGILFMNDFNEKVLNKILRANDLEFHAINKVVDNNLYQSVEVATAFIICDDSLFWTIECEALALSTWTNLGDIVQTEHHIL